ncbi:methylated-DNA--[protein]-cysteine S-methyltransferase [Sphingomonas sp.]|uniref:methylated-DNA--[protein]-cysteine S-methyltransferase n=1 Tax=Sphingomonas sp. TaxID=28214 RepID=UPI002B9990B4|nr:methylated-DNA--[protein]-cysteine S-methyltransferase [Sphingomonas sp.]HWK37224.1 methylated-DNA--[protein]-cysteine S-methyltransferase [Sphingomonas sp.]
MPYARDTALIATPVGTVRIEGDDQLIHRIAIERERMTPLRPDTPAVIAAAEQLEAWFDGALQQFDIALAAAKTPRGQILRDGLIAIGYGETRSYGALARALDSGPRAIGQLCARNPFPIVVPCHRVLGADGLGHYSAGDGVATKRWLLDHEASHGRRT